MKLDWNLLSGLKVLVMGLGLHGGGSASAEFFARHGARVTVTDLRSEAELRPSIERLSGREIRYVLGRHEEADFRGADIVIKNPAVPAGSPLLQAARQVETDISVFLALSDNPLVAVTGTKGKSTTSSAIAHVMRRYDPRTRLGGNITVSPLGFLDELASLNGPVPVVLELSSWQLGDLRGKEMLRPKVAVITNILHDHMNRYSTMDEYVGDKMVIVEGQTPSDYTICNLDDPYGPRFATATRAHLRWFSQAPLPDGLEGGWLGEEAGTAITRLEEAPQTLFRGPVALPGRHSMLNLLAAGIALSCFGVPGELIANELPSFPGIPHRLQFVAEIDGRRFYNDSAATIPEATAAAVTSFESKVVLIAGGTDKNLDFAPLRRLPHEPRCVILLAGSASGKLKPLLEEERVPVRGPFDELGEAVDTAVAESEPGDVVLLSPGCASFEMFKNEFDRGDRFVEMVQTMSRGE